MRLLLLALLVCSEALAAEPDLWRVDDAAPPSTEAARALASDLVERAREGTLDTAWLSEHLRPPHLPLVPSAAWVQTWRRHLARDRALGLALQQSPGPVAVLPGPTYQRVLLAPPPGLSVRIGSEGSRAVLHALEWTSCDLCDERVRFVADLIEDVAHRGRSARRLLPGVELDVSEHVARTPGGSDWVAGLQRRNHTGGWLAAALRGASVTGQDGDNIQVTYADGRVDSWHVVWRDGRWMVDYGTLAPDSPLRLGTREALTWREPSTLSRSSLATWTPTFRPLAGGAGFEIGHDVLDAWFDARDGTVLIAAMDLDRVLSAAFRVDPESHQVLERIPLPRTSTRTNLPTTPWFASHPAALSPDGQQLALGAPERVWSVDLETRQATTILRGDTALLAWCSDTGSPDLLVASSHGLWRQAGVTTTERLETGSAPIAARCTRTTATAVTRQGSVLDLNLDTATRVCCGLVSDAVFSEDGDTVLATCDDPCDTAAVWLNDGAVPIDIAGAGTSALGASISPDGAWFTTGTDTDAAHLLLWRASDRTPVARVPVGAVKTVHWSPDARRLLVVGLDGHVSLWERALLQLEQAL